MDQGAHRNFADFVENSPVDLKRKDAIAVLQEISKIMKNDHHQKS
jgi:hypothetical protein